MRCPERARRWANLDRCGEVPSFARGRQTLNTANTPALQVGERATSRAVTFDLNSRGFESQCKFPADTRQFVMHFRARGWLSATELSQVLSSAPEAGRTRAEALRTSMNVMLRKYVISSSRLRTAHFFAQVGQETGWWQYRVELGNERYFRTMYEVITKEEAAEDFRSGLAQRLGLVRSGESEEEYAARRPGVVAEKAKGMDNGVANAASGGQAGDGPRFRGRGFLQITGRRNYSGYGAYRGMDFTTDPRPAFLATDNFNACDASGFYWARERVNTEADRGAAAREVTRVGGIVNRGSAGRAPRHDAERRAAFSSMWSSLNDEV